jgi:hypothetical protein
LLCHKQRDPSLDTDRHCNMSATTLSLRELTAGNPVMSASSRLSACGAIGLALIGMMRLRVG